MIGDTKDLIGRLTDVIDDGGGGPPVTPARAAEECRPKPEARQNARGLRRMPARVDCKSCADTGLIELRGVPPATKAWMAAFTMMPCLCDRGVAITPAFEAARTEYRAEWQAYSAANHHREAS